MQTFVPARFLSHSHMAHVHERIPLVMTGTVGTHPRRNGFATAIFHCLRQILLVACSMKQFNRSQFHVIDPVVLLVDVGRNDAHRLGIAWLVNAHLVGISGLATNLGGKIGVIGCQNLCSQCKVTGKLARRAGRAHGRVHEFAALLRLAVDVIDRAAVVGSPAIVGRIVLGQLHADVVAVIGNLVVEFPLTGIHLIKPCEAPIDFIDDVRDAVGPLESVGLVMVTKGCRALLPGKHHLVDGVGTRGGILQQVGSIMPAAPHVDVLSLLVGVIAHVGILDVATVALERVKAAPLLTHVVEHKVGCAIPHAAVNRKYGRLDATCHDAVSALVMKVAEVQPARRLHLSPGSHLAGGGRAINRLARIGIHQFKLAHLHRLLTHEHGHLGRVGQVSQLVNAYPPSGLSHQAGHRHHGHYTNPFEVCHIVVFEIYVLSSTAKLRKNGRSTK